MLSIPEGRESGSGPTMAAMTELEREPPAAAADADKKRTEGESVSVNGEVSRNNQRRGLKRHISK